MGKRKSGVTFLEIIYINKEGKQITSEFESDLPLKRAILWAKAVIAPRCSEIIDIFELKEDDEQEAD